MLKIQCPIADGPQPVVVPKSSAEGVWCSLGCSVTGDIWWRIVNAEDPASPSGCPTGADGGSGCPTGADRGSSSSQTLVKIQHHIAEGPLSVEPKSRAEGVFIFCSLYLDRGYLVKGSQ